MLSVATVEQQIMTEFNGAVSEEAKSNGHHKYFLKSNEAKWPLRVHRPPKVIKFKANVTGKWRYELSVQLQGLLSETHLTPHKRSFIPNYNFYRTDR
jgi:hypothetical protein